MLKRIEDFVNFYFSYGTHLVMSPEWILMCLLVVVRVNSENNSTNGTFSPPPAESMSRLLPTTTTRSVTTVNATVKHENSVAASSIDLVTTPDPDIDNSQRFSLGLSAYSKFNGDMHDFQPSPFLGVISDQAHVKPYSTGVVVGEVFPDTVDKPNPHFGAHKYLYSIEGQQSPHTGHAYHDQVTIQRPTQVTGAYLPQPNPTLSQLQYLYTKKEATTPVHTSFSTLRPTHHVTEYPFEIPDKSVLRDVDNFQQVDNSISEYKPPAPFNDHKPIHEDVIEEKPFRHDLRSPSAFKFPAGGMMHSPSHFSRPKPIQIYPKEDNKWRDALKFFGSLIPIGLLLAAFTPSLIVVNATDAPTDASPVRRTSVQSGRALVLPESLHSLRLTSCQRRKMCESLMSLKDDPRMQMTVFEIIKRSGESYEELLKLSEGKQCSSITCPTR